MHLNSMRLFEKYAAPFVRPGLRVLEVGPDRSPSTYQSLAPGPVGVWDTIDFSGRTDVELTHHLASEYDFPLPADSYDLVISGQVIEHVRKVWRWMPELARVCKPGGHVVTICPVTYPYHEAPVDCWRIYPEGMKALCEEAGLETVLSTWESVNLENWGWLIPDVVKRTLLLPRLSGGLDMLARVLRVPANVMFDTVTIARKPTASVVARA